MYCDRTQADVYIIGKNTNRIVAEAVIEISDIPGDLRKEFFNNCRISIKPFRDGFKLELALPDYDTFNKRVGVLDKLIALFRDAGISRSVFECWDC